MNPHSAKNEIPIAALAAANLGLRNRSTSRIGCSVRRSHATNATASNAATAKPPSVRALPQPWLGASMIVNTNSPIVAADRTNPARSIEGASGSRELGT